MHMYDIVMIAILVMATLLGAWKGMAWQLASLASIGLSYYVATQFSGQLAPLFGDNAPWNTFIAMLVLYLATSMGIWLGFRLVAGAIDRIRLKEFDRQMGALFGAAKGVLLCVAITFFVVTLSASGRGSVLESRSGYYIAVLIHKATPMLPDEVDQVLGPYLEKLDQHLEPNHVHEPATASEQPQPESPESASAVPVGQGGGDDPNGHYLRGLVDEAERLLEASRNNQPPADAPPR